MITTGIQNIVHIAQAASQGHSGVVAVAAAAALGFLFIFNGASGQKRENRHDFEETDTEAFHTACAEACRKPVQPFCADELIAIAKDLARRVMNGTAPVSELLAMLDTLQRLGIEVHGLFAFGSAFLALKMEEVAEHEKAA